MENFKGVTESYRVSLLNDHGGSEPVICQVSLDGLILNNPNSQRTLKKYPLNYISRWALRGSSLVLYTRTPTDVEERTLTLAADDRVIRAVLDTLTCCCMQMVELLESQSSSANAPSTDDDRKIAEQLQTMLNSASNRKTLTADQVEYWHGAEKSGWMNSQGDVIKTWRRRWFVLKQGFLFRFGDVNVDHTSKPRGIVDLTVVQDVTDGREATGKANSLKLSTANGQVCYSCDSETEQVEWLSALEGAVQKIVRSAAGMEDETALTAAAAAAAAKPRPASRDEKQHNSEWASRLEAGFNSASRSGGGSRSGFSSGEVRSDRRSNPMVKVVAFDGAGQSHDYAPAQPSHHSSAYGGGGAGEYSGGGYSSIAGYGNVAGAKQAPEQEPLVSVTYGGYPGGGMQHSADSDTSMYSNQDHYSAYPQAPQQQQPLPQQPPAYGGSRGGAQYGQEPAQGGHQPSFMDTAPQTGNSSYYATLPYTTSAMQGATPAAETSWQMHHAPSGQPYWHNTQTGLTQWEQP